MSAYKETDPKAEADLAGKADITALNAETTARQAHEALTTTAHGGIVASTDVRLTDQRTPTDASVTDAKVATGAAIAPAKIAGTAVVNGDSRLSDARTPLAHKTTHAAGGSDALAPSDIGAVKGSQDTAANWTATNPVLTLGALGLERDTGKYKVGDGATAWGSLAYAAGGGITRIQDATDASATSLARDGFLAAFDGTLGKFVGKAPSGTFRLADELAVGDGVADDANPFRNAITAALAVQNAGGVGIVEANPTKKYLLGSGGPLNVFDPVNTSATAGWLALMGHGATIKLSTACKTAFQVANANAGQTVRNIFLDDWVIDASGATLLSATGYIAHFFGLYYNFDRLVFRELKLINAGSVANGARGINVGISRGDNYGQGGQPINSMTHVLADGCDIGVYGGSGGSGVFFGTFCNQTKNVADLVDQALPRAAAFIDDATIRGSKYESGSRGVSGATTGFMIGGDGWVKHCVIDDCVAAGSGDDNFEIAGALHAEVTHCKGIDGLNENFFFSNNHGGMPWGEEQHHILRGCKGIQETDGVCLGGNVAANYMNGGNGGRLTLDDVDIIMATDTFANYVSSPTTPAPTALLQIFGSPREVNLKVKATVRTNYVEPAGPAGLQTIAVQVKPRGQACTIRGSVESETVGSFQGTASGHNWNHFAFRVDDPSLAFIDDLRVGIRSSVKQVAGKVQTQAFSSGVKAQNKEPFTSIGRLAYSFKPVNGSGPLSDLTETGSVVQSAANHTVEKQLRLIEFSGSTDNVVSRMMDGSVFVGGNYQQVAGFLLGWRLRSSQDGATGIDVTLGDDGTNSTLKIDELVAGVRTNRDSFNLGARVADQAAIGIRAKVQANTVTLDYFTANAAPTFSTAGATTRTITSITAQRLTADGPLGFADVLWIPMAATAFIDNVAYDTMPVLTGRLTIDTLNVREPLDTFNALNWTKTDAQIRIQGRLRVRGTARKGRIATNVSDVATVAGTNTALMAGILFDGYTPLTAPAAKTGTTWTVGTFGGSGAAFYQSPGPWAEDVFGVLAAGATTPFLELSRDGGVTFTQVAFGASAVFHLRLQPGDVLRFTGAVPASLNVIAVTA